MTKQLSKGHFARILRERKILPKNWNLATLSFERISLQANKESVEKISRNETID
jgi:hypothetical protein